MSAYNTFFKDTHYFFPFISAHASMGSSLCDIPHCFFSLMLKYAMHILILVFFPVWVQLQNLPQTSPLYLQDLMQQGVILWAVAM
jgi:hypothetical protein